MKCYEMQSYIHQTFVSAMQYRLVNFWCWQLTLGNLGGSLEQLKSLLAFNIPFIVLESIKMDNNHSKLPHYHLKARSE